MNLGPDTLNEQHEIRLRFRAVDRNVGMRIRELRLSMGLTQSDLAEMAQSRFNQIHKIETGQNQISAGRLYLIACALGVSIDYFFDGKKQEVARSKDIRRMREFRRDLNRIADLADLKVLVRLSGHWKKRGHLGRAGPPVP
jgi:transcriptional regulator with XRE-family HTH domain